MPWLAPDLPGQVDNHLEFFPLLAFSQYVAFLGGGETALRTEAELAGVRIPGRLIDALFDGAPVLQVAGIPRR